MSLKLWPPPPSEPLGGKRRLFFWQRSQCNGWTNLISRRGVGGGLTYPDNSLVSHCSKVEEQFQNFHGTTVDMDPMSIESLSFIVKSDTIRNEIPYYVDDLFLKVRFFNQIKFLNVELQTQESSEKIRSAKQEAQHKNWINYSKTFLFLWIYDRADIYLNIFLIACF